MVNDPKKDQNPNAGVSDFGIVAGAVKKWVKGASGLDGEARTRLFPPAVPNSSRAGYSDVAGLQKAEAAGGFRPRLPVGESSAYGSSKAIPEVTSGPSNDLRKGVELGSGLTLTQNKNGEVGFWNAAGDRQDPKKTTFGTSPQTSALGQTTAGLGASSSNLFSGGMTNFTGRLAQDDQIFGLAMARAKDGTLPGGFFTGAGEPGPGTYGKNSPMTEFESRRTALISQLDNFRKNSNINGNSSVSDIIASQMQTKGLRDEIKHIDEQILGRTELANKIQLALLANRGALDTQSLKNAGDLAVQDSENKTMTNIWGMREEGDTARNNANLEAGKGVSKTAGRDYMQEKAFGAKQGVMNEALKSFLTANPNATHEEINAYISPFYDDLGLNGDEDQKAAALAEALMKKNKK